MSSQAFLTCQRALPVLTTEEREKLIALLQALGTKSVSTDDAFLYGVIRDRLGKSVPPFNVFQRGNKGGYTEFKKSAEILYSYIDTHLGRTNWRKSVVSIVHCVVGFVERDISRKANNNWSPGPHDTQLMRTIRALAKIDMVMDFCFPGYQAAGKIKMVFVREKR